MEKICWKCGILKNISEYYQDKKWLNWLRSVCKSCWTIYNKNRYENKKNEIRQKQKEYDKTESRREIYRLARSKRRASIKNTSDNTIILTNTKKLLKIQNYKCNYCWKDISEHTSRHLDHITPLSKWWIHSINNVQWLCCKCNLKKGNKIFDF